VTTFHFGHVMELHMSRLPIALVSLAVLALGINSASASITVLQGYHYTAANDHSAGYDQDYSYFYSLPEVGSQTSAIGGNSATTTYNLREESGATVLDWSFDHVRTGDFYNYAYSYGYLDFVANETTTYDISGLYQVDGGPVVYQYVRLYDYSYGDLLYSFNYTTMTEDELLEVGLPTGDTYNDVVGSTSGQVVAGTTYFIQYAYYIHAYPTGDSGATAEGNLNLTIGSVPEPSTFAIFGLMGLGMVVSIARRRARSLADRAAGR
jgi:hypothetical protein